MQTLAFKLSRLVRNKGGGLLLVPLLLILAAFPNRAQAQCPDGIPPTVTNCPGPITQNADPGQCDAAVTWTAPSFIDLCGISSVTSTHSPGATFPVGSTTVTYTATDDGGLTTDCSFTVTITDAEDPVLSACPTNITVSNDLGACTAVVTFSAPAATDNCPGVTVAQTAGLTSGSAFPLGTTTVTFTATDAAGNNVSCSFDVTVNDNEQPNAVCQPFTVNLDASGSGSITAADIDGGSTDNCGIASLSASQTSFGCSDVGANNVTLTVTDVNGNVNTCVAVVTVVDNVAPQALCQNATVQLNASGSATITAGDVDGGSTDACGIASLAVSPSTFNCSNVGTNTVTLTVTDVNGNSSTCTATVTVQDNVAPTAVCQNISIDLDVTGNASITGADIDGGSSDNCGIASLTASPNAFTCANLGPNTVTLTVTDVNGNSSTCTATVTVNDVTPPTITCVPIPVTLFADPGACIATNVGPSPTVAVDQCAPPFPGLLTVTNNSPFAYANGADALGDYPVGTTTVTFTATDASGNSSTCTVDVTVVDNEAPNAVCQNITLPLDASGNASITGADVDGGSTDNCGIGSLAVSPNSFDCSNLGANTVTLTVTDVNGNSSTCTATVTIVDNLPPDITCPGDITVFNQPGQCNAQVTYNVPAPDNCDPNPTIVLTSGLASGSAFPEGTTLVEWTATDATGNSATCSFTVTVIDNELPNVLCQPATVQLDASGNGSITAADIDGGSTDNCGIASLAASQTTFGCGDVGTNNVTLTVTDVNGNVNTCVAVVTVEDNVAPNAVCQAFTVQLDASGNGSLTAGDIDGGSTDACGIASLVASQTTFGCADVGANSVTLTVTDNNGNVSTCTATVTVEDNVPPTALCQVATVQLDGSGSGSITTADIDGGSSDACGIASLSASQTTFGCSDVTEVIYQNNFDAQLTNWTPTDEQTAAGFESPALATDWGGVFNEYWSYAADGTDRGLTVYKSSQTSTARWQLAITNNTGATLTDLYLYYDFEVPWVRFDNTGNSRKAQAQWYLDADGPGGGGYTTVASSPLLDNSGVPSGFATTWLTDAQMNQYGLAARNVVHNLTVSIPDGQTFYLAMGRVGSGTPADQKNMNFGIDNLIVTASPLPTVTLTVTDVNGNSSTCDAPILVEDNVPPTAICQNFTLALDASGNGSITTADIDNGSNDACGIASLALDQTNFTCADVGPNTVTLTVTDNNGNVSTCTSTVTVVDNIAPNAVCAPITIQLDASGNASITANDIDGGSTDNCGIASLSASQTAFGCADVGTNNVTLTVTDVNGNSSSCLAVVTVEDNVAPVITCPGNVTLGVDPGQCSAAVTTLALATATDNCPGVTITNDYNANGADANDTYPVGTTTVTFTATDASGNTATCSINVTVVDDEDPTIVCFPDITVNNALGQCGANVPYIISVNDNCPGETLAQTAGIPSGGFFPVGVTTNSFTVTDAAGNTASCSFTVTVLDTESPQIACPPDIFVNSDPGVCGAVVTYTAPTGLDNCPGSTTALTAGLASGATFPVGVTTVTYTVTDLAGNIADCSFDVTVTDIEDPVIVGCPTNITVNNDPGNCDAVVTWIPPTFSDNCAGAPIPGFTYLGTFGGNHYYSSDATFTWSAANLDAQANNGHIAVIETAAENAFLAGLIGGATHWIGYTDEAVEGTFEWVTGISSPYENWSPGEPNNIGNSDYVIMKTDGTWNDIFASATRKYFLEIGVSQINSPTPGSVFPVGTTNIAYSATDQYGNAAAACSFSVTVIDNEAPTINCPADIVVNNDPGQCGALVTYTPPVGTDNCPGAFTLQTGGLGSGSFFTVGTTTETYTVFDAAGNSTPCSFTVTVLDTEDPQIVCPADITVSNDPGICGAVVTYTPPVGTDNCASGVSTSQTAGLGSGATFPVGTTTETYTVTDAAGNSVSCSFTVTVTDSEDPVITCPADITVNNDPGQCGAVVTFAAPVGTDNCPTPVTSQTAGQASGTLFPVGTTLQTFLVTDAAGNTASCSFNVTVIDNEAPVLTCPTPIVQPNDPFQCNAVVTVPLPGIVDNCPGPYTITYSTTNGLNGTGPANGIYPVGTHTVTYTVVDVAGNTSTCTVDVTVNDVEAPQVGCPPFITFAISTFGQLDISLSPAFSFNFDNCAIASTTFSQSLFDCSDVGTTTPVTITVTDIHGNSNTCVSQVTIVDNLPPVPTCPADITVNVDPGQCDAVVTFADPTATDNCPGTTFTQTGGLASGAAFPVGTTTNSYEFTDAAGNTATCSFTITVIDNEPPTATCPAPITQGVDPGQCGANVTYTVVDADNCPGQTIVQTSGIPSGGFFPVGTTTNAFLVTDAAGNTATCSFTVTIVDDEDPVITCPADITVNNDPGQCGANVVFTVPVGTDNCPGANTIKVTGFFSGAFFPVGTTLQTYKVTDAAGNEATCTFNITVIDNEAPTITCPADITVNVDPGQCDAVVTYSVPSADNCPGAVTVLTGGLGSGATFPVGTTTESYEITDASGNTATCSFTVTVIDNELPQITCPADITVNVDPGQCGALVNFTPPVGTDNCPAAVTSQLQGLTSGSLFPVGTTTQEYEVVDASGNTASCSFTVTVIDNEDPVITCPSDITVNVDPGQCDAVVSYTVGTSDNCPNPILSQTAGFASGSAFPVGTTTNSFDLTDASGNTVSCSFTVTVIDNEDPVITCPPDIIVGVTPGSCDAVVTFTTPVGTDNCPGAVTTQLAGLASGATFPLGTTLQTFEVVDAAGNSASCSFNVTVIDNDPPTLVCPADITVIAPTGQCDAVVTYTAPVGTDGCPGVNTTQTAGLGSGATFPVGTTTETYVATDAAGNTTVCSFTVTVLDQEDPVINCPPDITVNASSGQCFAQVFYTGVTATDNCQANVALVSGVGNGGFFPVGVTTETYEAVDPSGNTVSCSFTVTVLDVEDPTITCPADITVSNDPGQCGALVVYTHPTGADNCSGAVTNLTSGLGSGAFFPVGTTTETYTVTDAAGNTATCSFTVTVEDNEAPVLTCPADITVTAGAGLCDAVVFYPGVVANDNCPGPVVVSLVAGINSGGTFPIGTTTVTYEGVDGPGNVGTCSFTVTVLPAVPGTQASINMLNPTEVCQDDPLQLAASTPALPGEIGTWTWSGPGGVFLPDAQDPAAILTDLNTPGLYDLTWTITDGCQTSSATIKVQVNPTPTGTIIETSPISAFGASDGQLLALPGSGTPGYFFQWDDPALTTTPSVSNLPTGTYTVIITDSKGCSSGPISYFLDQPPAQTVLVSPRIYLQQAVDPNTGLMDDNLRTLPDFPTTEPYTAQGYAPIVPGSGLTVGGGVLGVSGNQAVVDWVFVELRDKVDPSIVVGRQPALLLRNGDIVDASDGSSPVAFVLPADDYFVAVRHRNHLGIMSANAITLNQVTTTTVGVDFIDNATLVNGTDPMVVVSGSGFAAGTARALWGGDANNDKVITYAGGASDLPPVSIKVLLDPGNPFFSLTYQVSGYHIEDLNTDGLVTYAGAATDITVITTNILLHPNNTLFSLTFQIFEQIP
jgi:hypothetical protein